MVFIDAIFVKVREGQVANRPIYVAVGVTVEGERDILGLWAGEGGEGAKYWHHVLTEIRNRGTADVCTVVCDGLTGLPDAVGAVWPQAVVQTCIVHLLRNSFRYASRKDWPAIAKGLKTVYTAPTEAAAMERLAEFAGDWEDRYPAIVKLWENAWAEFVPFLSFDPEVRAVMYTTDDIVNGSGRCVSVASGQQRLHRHARPGRRSPSLGRVALSRGSPATGRQRARVWIRRRLRARVCGACAR